MTSSIRRKQNLAEAVTKISKGSRVYGTVREVVGNKATVKITGGAKLTNLTVVGGTVVQGENVLVEWNGVEPYVRANTPGSAASSTIVQTSLSSHSTAQSSDPLSLAGWTVSLDGVISTDKTRIEPGGRIVLGDASPADSVVVLDGEDLTYRIWAGALLPTSAPFSVSKLGAIKSTLGDIGGWNITANEINSDSGSTAINSLAPSIKLGATGYNSGTGIWMGKDIDSTYKLFIGYATGNKLLWNGTNLSITGTIYASAGDIGGWNIGQYTITADSGSVGLNSQATIDTDWRIWAGNANPSLAPFRVNENGDVWLESATISGDFQSSNFLSGYRGWQITQDGKAEFNDITVRGEILTSIFKYNEIAAVAGDLGVFKGGGVLTANLTTVASPTEFTMYYEGSTLEVNDIVRIKDGFYDNWCLVTAVVGGGEYTLELKNGTPTTFAEGITVVNYGPSGQGGILLTANMTNAPFIDIFTHAGQPWTDMTPKTRIGQLHTGLDATLLPTGYGLYSDNAYLKGVLTAGGFSVDPTDGMKLACADSYDINRSIKFMYGSSKIGEIWQLFSDSATVNRFKIELFPYAARHSSMQYVCSAPGSYTATWSASAYDDYYSVGITMQASNTVRYVNIGGGGLLLGSDATHDFSLGPGNLDMTGNLRLDGGIYVGSKAGTPLDNGILATGDIRTSHGLSVGSTTNDPAAGHLWAIYDGRFGGGLYVGAIDTDPATGVITATSYIRAGSGLYIGSTTAGNPGLGNLTMTGVLTSTGLIRTGAGLYVGSTGGADPGTGNIVNTGYIITSGVIRSNGNFQRGTTDGYIYVPLTTHLTPTGWNGASRSVGNYIVDVSTAYGGDTSHIKAYSVRFLAKWAAAAETSELQVKEISGGGNVAGIVRAHEANFWQDGACVVKANADGDFYVQTLSVGPSSVWMIITGYYL